MAAITTTAFADARTTEILSGLWLQSLADRNALPNHPALVKVADLSGKGSVAAKVPIIPINGATLLTSVAEGSSITPTAITPDAVSVSVARFGKAHGPTDLARWTDATGVLNPPALITDGEVSYGCTIVNGIANIGDGFTDVRGTSAAQLTHRTLIAARGRLAARQVPGPFICLLHADQWQDLADEAAYSVTGALQHDPASIEKYNMWGPFYKGRHLQDVDIFVTTRVPSDGGAANRMGCMFGAGGIVWADAAVQADIPAQQISIADRLLIELERDALGGITNVVTSAMLGFALGEDDRGVTIRSRILS